MTFELSPGKLICLALMRPDIAFVVGVVSQIMHTPRTLHLEATYHIMRYLKLAPGSGLLFSNNVHMRVKVYKNADWADSMKIHLRLLFFYKWEPCDMEE